MGIMELVKEIAEFEAQGVNVITITGASVKFGVHDVTLLRWARRGIIRVVRPSPGPPHPTLLDEKSVEEAVRAYRKNPGQGKHTMDIRTPVPVGS